jgi:Domain of unknown function (DUF4159)
MMRSLLLLTLMAAIAMPASAQRRRGGRRQQMSDYKAYNVQYSGDFTFVRIRYTEEMWGFRPNPGWFHDYPTAERNFTKLVDELTNVRPDPNGSNILMFDDPELFNYPIAYLSEPGYWMMSDAEAQGLRNYLLKGGFLIVDDFKDAREWYVFEERVHQALPAARLVQLDATDPIFDSFFHIPSLDGFRNPNFPVIPVFYGVYEDNDPSKRLMMIVNYNNDIGDYWEWSDTGWLPIELSNEAYKLGINYLIYGMMR